MRLTHFSNSFLIVQTEDLEILCDPWVGTGNHGGWHSFPEFRRDDLIRACASVTHVCISHLHSDHFDPAFLKLAGLTVKPFFIKRFADGILKKRLSSLGVEQIIEIEAFTKHKLSTHTYVTIVPQMTSNSAEADDQVGYDLDTSLIVHSAGHTFFKKVDNPFSGDNYSAIKHFLAQQYGEVSIACFTCGAAGEYPQCFLNVDRALEQEKIICSSLDKLAKAIETIAPRRTFIAGGSYFIPGKFSLLNRFIAQPTFDRMKHHIGDCTETFVLEGSRQINLREKDPVAGIVEVVAPVSLEIETSVSRHAGDVYEHQQSEKVSDLELRAAFAATKENYRAKLARLGIKIKRDLHFKFYEDLRVDEQGQILTPSMATLHLQADQRPAENGELVIHIDASAAFKCLTRKAIWNQTLSGSLCLFERTPNTYEPEVLFSLNFLTA